MISRSSRPRADRTSVPQRGIRGSKIIDKELFIQLNRDPSRSALILGSGRGGTTWIAEQLARSSGSRMLFEPFHACWSPVKDDLPLFLGPDSEDPSARRAASKIL